MLFFINLVLVLVSAFFLIQLTGVKQRVVFLLGIYILGYANVVLIEELAGLFSVLNWKVVFGLQIVYTLIAYFLWAKFTGGGFSWRFIKIPRLPFNKIWENIKAYPEVAILGMGVLVVYLLGAGMILVIPPDNNDSLVYHLSRVGYWLQYQSLYPWPTINVRQTTFPMNVELGVLWTILWWGTDQLAGFVQWVSVIVIVLSVYSIIRLMGYSRIAGVTTTLLFPTLTQVLFQSTTTQNDLTTAAIWSCMIFFYFAGIKLKDGAYFILSAIAFGLAMGAKSTSLIMLPVWLFLVGISYVRDRSGMFVPVKLWIFTSLVSVLFFGSYIYIQNQVAYGGPLGPGGARPVAGRDRGADYRFELLRDNLARYGYQMVDFSPLPSALSSSLNLQKQKAFTSIYSVLHIPVENTETAAPSTAFQMSYFNLVNEDHSWFGPLMVFLLLSIVIHLVRWKGNKYEVMRVAPLILFLGFLFLLSAAEKWTPAKGRYYIIPVAVSFPALAVFFSFSSERINRTFRIIFVLLGLTSMVFIRFGVQNSLSILPNMVSLQRRSPSWENVIAFKYVSREIPPNSDIGTVPNQGGVKDYPLFGMGFIHGVRPFPLEGDKNMSNYLAGNPKEDYLERFQQSEYIYLGNSKENIGKNMVPENFHLVLDSGPVSIWARDDVFSKLNSCEKPQWPLNELILVSQDLHCVVWAQFPLVYSSELYPSAIVFGLVNDPDTNFQVRLFSLENKQVRLKFKMTPLRPEVKNQQIDIHFLHNGEEYYFKNIPADTSVSIMKIDLPKGETLINFHLNAPPLRKNKNPVQMVRLERILVNLP